jgi:hypothetical protein
MSSNHDVHDTHDAGGHDDHGAEAHDHGVDTDTYVTGASEPQTPLSAFIWPLLIALITLALVWGPVTGAFASRRTAVPAGEGPSTGAPAGGAGPEQSPVEATLAATTPLTGNSATVIPQPTNVLTALPTNVQAGGTATLAPAATDTAAPVATDTAAPVATDTAAPAATTGPALTATLPPAATATTSAALPPNYGDVAGGAPRRLAFGGKTFRVQISNTTLPDWVFSKDPGVANWVSGTVVNYVLGLSYSEAGAALFAAAHPADTIRLVRADGGVYTFVVDKVQRVARTDTRLLAQDHPAITILLLGDPANDRAVVQGHFSEVDAR